MMCSLCHFQAITISSLMVNQIHVCEIKKKTMGDSSALFCLVFCRRDKQSVCEILTLGLSVPGQNAGNRWFQMSFADLLQRLLPSGSATQTRRASEPTGVPERKPLTSHLASVSGQLLRLKMFREDHGSWMTMFFSTVLFLFIFSHIYNTILLMDGNMG